MRSATRRSDPRLRALVALLHEEGAPAAETWRRVGAAAEAKGLLRPSYPLIRRLVALERFRRQRRAELREVVLDAAQTFGAGRVPDPYRTIGRITDLRKGLAAIEASGSETRAISRGRGP